GETRLLEQIAHPLLSGEPGIEVGEGDESEIHACGNELDRASIPSRLPSLSQPTTRYTWNTSAYSRFTLMPCVRATFHTYSAFAYRRCCCEAYFSSAATFFSTCGFSNAMYAWYEKSKLFHGIS